MGEFFCLLHEKVQAVATNSYLITKKSAEIQKSIIEVTENLRLRLNALVSVIL